MHVSLVHGTADREYGRAVEEIEGIDRLLIQSTPLGAWVLDEHGITVWFNPVMCTFLGRSSDELDGMSAHEAFDEQGRRDFDAFLARMRAGAGSEPAVECLLHRPDGSATWVLITANTMQLPDGSLFILRVIDFDLRRSLNDQLRQAQELGRMGSWRIDYETGQSSWSDELFRVLGRDPDDGPMSPEEFTAMVVDED